MTGIFRPLTEVTLATALTFGLLVALLASLKLVLARRLNLGTGLVGSLLLAFNAVMLPTVFLGGLLIDQTSVQPMLIASSVLAAVGVFALGFHPGVTRAFAAIILAGVGSAGLCVSAVVLMPLAFFGPSEPSPSLNLGYAFFALGTLLAPPLAEVLMRYVGFTRALALLALACLAPAALAALVDFSEYRATAIPADLSQLFEHPGIWLSALTVVLYAPLEASVSTWAASQSHAARRAAEMNAAGNGAAHWVISTFWAAFLVSRLLTVAVQHAHLLPPWADAFLLVLPALLVAVVLGNLSATPDATGERRGMFFIGLLLGPILPTIIGVVFRRMDDADVGGHGMAFGLLFAAGSIGSLLLSPLVGSIARRSTPQLAMRVPMFGALVLTAVALIFGLAGESK